jgi:MmeI, C-terminal domain
MPGALLKAHQELDRAVERCYRPEPFPSDRHRVEYLFGLYEQLIAPLVAAAKSPRKGRKLKAVA